MFFTRRVRLAESLTVNCGLNDKVIRLILTDKNGKGMYFDLVAEKAAEVANGITKTLAGEVLE